MSKTEMNNRLSQMEKDRDFWRLECIRLAAINHNLVRRLHATRKDARDYPLRRAWLRLRTWLRRK